MSRNLVVGNFVWLEKESMFLLVTRRLLENCGLPTPFLIMETLIEPKGTIRAS
jgi:hypothetical protein